MSAKPATGNPAKDEKQQVPIHWGVVVFLTVMQNLMLCRYGDPWKPMFSHGQFEDLCDQIREKDPHVNHTRSAPPYVPDPDENRYKCINFFRSRRGCVMGYEISVQTPSGQEANFELISTSKNIWMENVESRNEWNITLDKAKKLYSCWKEYLKSLESL
jgi:hypothetical protein